MNLFTKFHSGANEIYCSIPYAYGMIFCTIRVWLYHMRICFFGAIIAI